MRVYSWSDWNTDHIGRHNVTPAEARQVVEHARSPYPEHADGGKLRVRGKTESGR